MYFLGWIVLVLVGLIAVGKSTTIGTTLDCDFEDPGQRLCSWVQSTEDSTDLVVNSGSTPTAQTGPIVDHTIGDNSGTYLYREANDRSDGHDAVLISPVVNASSGGSLCFTFWYSMFGDKTGTLNVYANPVEQGSMSTPLFSIFGQQTGQSAWLQAQVDLSNQTSAFNVSVELITINSVLGDIAIDDLAFLESECANVSLSFNCSFDEGSCGWTQSTADDSNWALERGRTRSYHTGPVIDHTTGTDVGLYYYFETDRLSTNEKVVLLSPTVAGSQQDDSWCFSLWYNMYGQETGTLNVYSIPTNASLSTQTPIFSITGQQTGLRVWLQAMVNVNQTSDFMLALEAVFEVGKLSDIAIDDVTISEGACSSDDNVDFNCDFEEGYCGWSQPTDDSANWALERGATYSSKTGPDFDHTIGGENGTYLFLETNGVSVGASAVLLSPVVQTLTGNRSFTFWYSMFGSQTGDLNVSVTPVSGNISRGFLIFSRSGQQTNGQTWLQATVALTSLPASFRIAFEATTAGTTKSDIAIDDIEISFEDTEAPEVTCPTSVPSMSTDSGMSTAIVPWSPQPSATDNVDVFDSSNITCQDEAGNIVVSNGTYELLLTTVTCNATDVAGNEGSCIFTITVLDTEAPEVTCPSSVPSMSTDSGLSTATVPWSPQPSATDNVDVFDSSNITCQDEAGNIVASNVTYALGLTTVTCNATDVASNEGSCNFTITVIDTETPEVTCPTSVPPMSTDSGMSTAIVPWSPQPSATDNVDVFDSSNITCQDEAGNIVVSNETYALGLTTVTCNATDVAGNEGSCNFNITVIDTETPEVTCPTSVPSMSTDSGMSTAIVPWSTQPSATDNVDVFDSSNITCQDEAGNIVVSNGTYVLGLTTVTCNATDVAGNEDSCYFTITVIDTETPDVACPSSVPSMSTDIGMSTAIVPWSPQPSATDNVDVFDSSNITCQDEAGNIVVSNGTYALGLTTVTCNATDVAGNEDSCNFTITVIDTEAPEVTCPSSVPSMSTDSGLSTAIVPWSPQPSATDNVDVFDSSNITCQDEAGNIVVSNGTYALGLTTVTCNATDVAGNEGSCNFTITVIDVEAPVIVYCPQNMVNETAEATLSFTWTPPNATDNVDSTENITVSSSHNPGDNFTAVQVTEVTYAFTDTANNTATTCVFNITVIDIGVPVFITCPNRLQYTLAAGQSRALVDFAVPRVEDNSGEVIVPVSDPQIMLPAYFSSGEMLISYNATDASGNSAEPCVFTLIINDEESPVFTGCPQSPVHPLATDPGNNTASYEWVAPVATDNVAVTAVNSSYTSPALLPIGNTTIQYIAYDAAGNTAICEFEVQVVDLEAPTIIGCPADITNITDTGLSNATVYWQEPTFTDNDRVSANESTHRPGDVFPLGNTTVMYNVIDISGNMANCTFLVTVQDDEPPTFSNCPQVILTGTDPGEATKNVTWVTLEYQDNVGVDNVVSSHESGDTFNLGNTSVTISATDEAQNTANCSFVVTVVDDEPPRFNICPGNVVNTTDPGMNSSVVYWQEPVVTDNVRVVTNGSSHSPGDIFPLGSTNVTYNVSDGAGNTNNCSFVVLVEDDEPPELLCPIYVVNGTDPGQNSSVVFWEDPTFTDNVGVVRNESSHSPGDMFPLGNTTVTYTVSDSAGNMANCSFLVNIEDKEAPMFISCPADSFNTTAPSQNSTAVYWREPSFSDNVGITSNVNTHSPGDVFIFGNTTVTYTISDEAGNMNNCSFVVTVEDIEDPTVSNCPTDRVNGTDPSLSSSLVYWQEPIFFDNVAVAGDENTHDPGDVFPLGNTTVTYTATDGSGNRVNCSFVVTVEDTEAPLFSSCSSITVAVDPGQATSTLQWMLPEASDNVAVTMNSSTYQPDDSLPLGRTPVAYIVYDAAGNNATCNFDITVEDNEMPNITYCPMDVTLNTTRGQSTAVYTMPTPVCQDNAGSVTLTASKSDEEYSIGDTPVTIACLDEAGNIDVCDFTVTVLDVELPRLPMCPDDIEAFADPGMNATITWTPPTAQDNSGAVDVTSNYSPLDRFMNGTYLVIYTATDLSSNAVSCNFTITVYPSDNLAPMAVSCPNDTIIPADPGVNFTVVTWPPVVISDNVGVTSLDVSHPNGSTFYIGSVMVSYIASDLAGNTAPSCNFTVTVEDTEPPVITNCSGDIVAFTAPNSNGASVTWDDPKVNENDVYSIMQTPSPGHLYLAGNTTVIYFVRDRSGLNDTCEFLVTVLDNQPPVFRDCPSNMMIPTDAGSANATIFMMQPEADDNVGIISITNSTAPGTVVDLGETLSVVYVAYDAAGFNDTCQFEITVVDEEDPMILNCLGDVVINTTLGTSRAQAFWNEPTATDNSGSVTVTATNRPGDVFEIGSTDNTYIALDEAGHVDSCTFRIIVEDLEDPTLTMCPMDVDIFTPPGTNISVTWTQPTAADNSGSVNLSSNYIPGDRFVNGTYIVTHTAADASGNTVNCSFIVRVNSTDTEPPMIICPSDVTVPADNGTNSTVVTWPPPPYMDNNRVVSVSVSKENGSLFYIGTEVVEYVAYDVVGNNDTCSFKVTVTDMQDPVVVNCPVNVNQTTDVGQAFATVSWIEPTITDNSGSIDIDRSHPSPSAFPVGTTEVVYLASDNSSNSVMCAFNVTVTDNESPMFDCPSDLTNSTLPGRFVGTFSIAVTATDNVNVTFSNSTHQPGDELAVGTTHVEYYAQDEAGNEAFCRFIVTIKDDEKPQILNCSSDVYANTSRGSDMAILEWAQPEAMDNSGMVTLTSDRNVNGMYPIGGTVVNYNALDSSGNFETCQLTIHVYDMEDPMITCPRNIEVFADSDTTIRLNWTLPTASDNSGRLTLNITHQLNSEFPVGTTDITVAATDPSGNSANCTFSAIVYPNDSDMPMIICPPDVSGPTDQGVNSTNLTWIAPQYRDNQEIVVFDVSHQNGSRFYLGTTFVTYFIADRAGNNASCSFRVHVVDTEKPVFLDCANDVFISNGSRVFNWTQPTVVDNSGGSVNVTSNYPSGVQFLLGDKVVLFTAEDESGNRATCNFTVFVEDLEPPVFSSCPNGIELYLYNDSTNASATWTEPSASDNSGNFTLEQQFFPGDAFSFGITEVVINATDEAGNTMACVFNVTVSDLSPPVIVGCPGNVSTNTDPSKPTANVSWSVVMAQDNIEVASLIPSQESGIAFPVGMTQVIYTATDTSGNTDEDKCSFYVQVTDNETPMFVDCPGDMTFPTDPGIDEASVSWAVPTAVDNVNVTVFEASHQPNDNFSLGTRDVMYRVADSAGNNNTCTFTITINDEEGPVFQNCPDNVTVETDPGSDMAIVTWDALVAIDNGGAAVSPTSNSRSGDSFSIGSTTVSYVVADPNNNIGRCEFEVIVVDKELPEFSICPSDVEVIATRANNTSFANWTDPVATDNSGSVNVSLPSRMPAQFPIGRSPVVYTATDPSGNSANCSFNIIVFSMDMLMIACPADVILSSDPGLNSTRISWPAPIYNSSLLADLFSTHANNSRFEVGQTVVVYTITDTDGRNASCDFFVTVTGHAAPFFTSCPSNVVTNTTMGQSYAVVTWTVPQAQDDDSIPIVIEMNGYTPGRQFTMGMWMVTYVATDSIGQTASCEFNITVLDQEDPVIQGCPADINKITLDNAPIIIMWTPPTARDNSGEYTLLANDNHTPGETLNVGMYEVVYTVTDPSGNTALCQFEIIIENDAPPEFTSCPPSTSVSTDPGQSYATVGFSYPSPTDDRSNPSLFGSHAPGHQFPIGDTTITYTAYDSAGQSAECVFVITVQDRGDPVIIGCPSDQTVWVLSTTDVAAVYWTPPTANDTSNFTLTSTKDPGDTFESGSTRVTYTATDSFGNMDTCSFSVIVQETLPTYETVGSVEFVSIGSMVSPFTSSDVAMRLATLRDDMDALFRRSSVSSDFAGITLTGSSVETNDKALIQFDIFFTGSPAPNDTQITEAFYAALGPVENQFETGNEIKPGTFMLSFTECQQTPCENGGSCVSQSNSFICMCTSFWTGDYCETDVNECIENNPCASDRVCINLQGSFLCGCPAGFFLVGDTCMATSEFSGAFAITRIGSSEATFTPDLEDPTSDRYERLAGDVTTVLDSLFSDESSYVGSRVLGMSSGSIMIRYVLVFTEDTSMNEDAVTRQMSSSVSADGEIGSSALYIRLSSLTVASQICPSGFCKNGGRCSPDPVTYENTCTCESLYSGNRCEIMDAWSPLAIAMIAVAVALLLILTGLFISCCIFLCKRLDKEQFKHPHTRDVQQRDSFLTSWPVALRQSSARISFASLSRSVDSHGDTRSLRDNVRDNPQSSTFMRPYVATGQEAIVSVPHPSSSSV
ncbi:uncharacterized protein LOC119741140 isoform X2 [Patiria miniata]|uniref:Hyalin n=1 Tax=Patiria miniata TaxID=46514 RepID=A0A914B9H4_PATMI|nr:uncharacterized protein LOC119741140 isoform X2 [Patiria miniata]